MKDKCKECNEKRRLIKAANDSYVKHLQKELEIYKECDEEAMVGIIVDQQKYISELETELNEIKRQRANNKSVAKIIEQMG